MHRLGGERVLLRPLREADVPAVVAVLADPEVLPWWGPHDADRVRAELLDDETAETLVVEVDGEVIGLVMIAEENDPQYRSAGLDISLRGDRVGKGLGRECLRVAIEHLIDDRGHHRFTIDPAVDNERAIRCYTAVGFKPVGVMRQYERTPDGKWRDGLLMDLLADEYKRRG
jgi:aminoglycoside 6'-N-acetyltransferase